MLSKLLNKNKKQPPSLSQTARMSSLGDAVSVREQEEEGHDERSRARSGLEEEGVGEGEMDSDFSYARWKGKEKARFHSLLSVVDGEGVQVEKELEGDSEDGYEWEEESWGKRLFDARR